MIDSFVQDIPSKQVEISSDTRGLSSFLIDTQSPVVYIGESAPGTATSAAAWRIMKIDTTNPASVKYASVVFDKIWDDRTSLEYY